MKMRKTIRIQSLVRKFRSILSFSLVTISSSYALDTCPPAGDPNAISWEIITLGWVKNIYADGSATATSFSGFPDPSAGTGNMFVWDINASGEISAPAAVEYSNASNHAGYDDWIIGATRRILPIHSSANTSSRYWGSRANRVFEYSGTAWVESFETSDINAQAVLWRYAELTPESELSFPQIADIKITNRTDTSLSLEWLSALPTAANYLDSDVSYEVRYRPENGNWQTEFLPDRQVTLHGLDSATPYEIEIRPVVGGSGGTWTAAPAVATQAAIVYENEEVIVMLGARGEYLYSEDLAQDVVEFIFEEALVDSLLHYVGAASTPIGWLTFVAGFIPDALGGAEDPEFIPFTTYPMNVK